MKWLALVTVALFAGCGRKTMSDDERKSTYVAGMKPVLAKHAASATAVVDGLKLIPSLAAAEPPVTAPQPLASPLACTLDTCVITTAEPVLNIKIHDMPSTVMPMHWDALPVMLRGEYRPDAVWQADEHTLATIAAISHVAVVRTREFEKPTVTGDHYTGGRASGDVIVYEVKTKKRIGAFPWVAGMPETAEVAPGATDLAYVLASRAPDKIRMALNDFYTGKATAEAPKDDAQLRQRQITGLLGADFQILVTEVLITDGPPCKVDLVTPLPGKLAATPGPEITTAGPDDVVKPEVAALVRKVIGNNDCAVSYRTP